MSHPSLSIALGLHTQPIATPSISAIFQLTQYFPISWRKHILTVCRIQGRHIDNDRLQALLEDLSPNEVHIPDTSSYISKEDLGESLDLLYGSHILYSMTSFWNRGESMDCFEAREALDSGINKELSASQQGNREQVLNYDFLSGYPGRVLAVHVLYIVLLVYVNHLFGTTNS